VRRKGRKGATGLKFDRAVSVTNKVLAVQSESHHYHSLFTNFLLVFECISTGLPLLGATITWTAPPPQRGPLQQSDTSIRRTTQRLLNASTEVQLKWDFILSGEILDRVSWEIDNVPIGRKTSSGIIVIEPTSNFREHFNISASDPATLIIYKVTEADEAVFKCNVESTLKTWVDEIQVKIDGE